MFFTFVLPSSGIILAIHYTLPIWVMPNKNPRWQHNCNSENFGLYCPSNYSTLYLFYTSLWMELKICCCHVFKLLGGCDWLSKYWGGNPKFKDGVRESSSINIYLIPVTGDFVVSKTFSTCSLELNGFGFESGFEWITVKNIIVIKLSSPIVFIKLWLFGFHWFYWNQ